MTSLGGIKDVSNTGATRIGKNTTGWGNIHARVINKKLGTIFVHAVSTEHSHFCWMFLINLKDQKGGFKLDALLQIKYAEVFRIYLIFVIFNFNLYIKLIRPRHL